MPDDDDEIRRAAKEQLKKARAEVYRSTILSAAEKRIARVGYGATKMQQVARDSGISLATLYQLYEGKQVLYDAIRRHRHADLMSASLAELNLGDGDPISLLLQGVASSARFHMAHRDYLKLQLREGHAWSSPDALHTREQVVMWQQGITLLQGVFKRGVAMGLFPRDGSPRLMARTLMAIHQVHLADWIEGTESSRDASSAVGSAAAVGSSAAEGRGGPKVAAGDAAVMGEKAMIYRLQRQMLRAFCVPAVAAKYLSKIDTGTTL